MCDELDLDGVRRWFYGGTPPAGDGWTDEADVDARAFAAAVVMVAEARAAQLLAPPEPAPRARSRIA